MGAWVGHAKFVQLKVELRSFHITLEDSQSSVSKTNGSKGFGSLPDTIGKTVTTAI